MSDLIKKLNQIQREIHVPKNQFNSFGKYNFRKLEDILQAVKPLLGDDCIIKFDEEVKTIGDREYVLSTATILLGTEAISATSPAMHPLKIGSMSDPQLTGTAVTYARKGSIGSLLLLDDNPEVDSMQGEDDPYADMAEEYHELIESGEGLAVYMFTQILEVGDRAGLWSSYKSRYIASGEIGKTKAMIKVLADAGRSEALLASAALNSDDETEVAETQALYTQEQIDFILTIS